MAAALAASRALPEIKAAISLARQANRPVRVVADRFEELSYSSLRPGSTTETALVTRSDGTPEAIQMHAYGHGGIAIGTSPSTIYALMAPRATARDLADFSVLTNTAPGTHSAPPMHRPSAGQSSRR